MVNILFIEQRNITFVANLSTHCFPSHQSPAFENFTSINITDVATQRINITTQNCTEGIYFDKEYTTLTRFYLVPAMSMTFASVASLCAFCLSNTVKNVLVTRKNDDWSDNKEAVRKLDLAEITLLTGLVILEFCRSGVMNSANGLMVTYMVKHLDMEKVTASQVSSSGSFASVLSQLVGIVLIPFISAPVCFGIVNLIMMIINIVFTLTIDNHNGLIWIWAILNGTLLPNSKMSLYTWFYQSISITTFRTSLLLAGFTGGAMAGSALTGYMMTRYNPGWFIFTLDGILVCSNVAFVLVYGYHIYVTKTVRNYKLLR